MHVFIKDANRLSQFVENQVQLFIAKSATTAVCQKQTSQSLHEPIKGVLYDHVIVSVVNQPSELIHYDSVKEFHYCLGVYLTCQL